MSMKEMESKVRELRQLQSLIDEATAEAEALKDAIKAAMGDAEEVRDNLQTGHSSPEKEPPRHSGAVHQDTDHAPVLRGINQKEPLQRAKLQRLPLWEISEL